MVDLDREERTFLERNQLSSAVRNSVLINFMEFLRDEVLNDHVDDVRQNCSCSTVVFIVCLFERQIFKEQQQEEQAMM